MSYKAVVLDIDGTLVNSQKQITKKTLDVLTKIRNEGKTVVIASGRPPQGVMPYAKKLGFDKTGGYILSFNGGRITQVKTGETIYNRCFPNEYLPEICEIIKDYRVTINTYENDTIVTSGNLNNYSSVEADIIGLETNFVDDFAAYVNFEVNKCLLSGEPEDILKLEELLKKKYEGRLDVYRSEEFFLELVPLGVDKAQSIDFLLKTLGCKREECMACGDGYNDLTMIEYAGLGVAMENANDEVKAAADFVTLSNDNDGVAYAVEKFVN